MAGLKLCPLGDAWRVDVGDALLSGIERIFGEQVAELRDTVREQATRASAAAGDVYLLGRSVGGWISPSETAAPPTLADVIWSAMVRPVRESAPGALVFAMLFAIGFGCGRSRTSSLEGAGEPKGGCGHAVCEDDFVVDAIAPVDCSSGERCQMTVKLVALGDNRVNDEYRFRFVADQKPFVQFQGPTPPGRPSFPKAAGDWRKDDASRRNGREFVVLTPGAIRSNRAPVDDNTFYVLLQRHAGPSSSERVTPVMRKEKQGGQHGVLIL